jgi:hypothetical protein
MILLSIPYFNTIETTLIKIFNETTEKSGKTPFFVYNGFLSMFDSTLFFGRICYDFFLKAKNQERFNSLESI